MMQADKPDDFVIATGESHTVREFCELAFEQAGLRIAWQGKGRDEIGIDPTGRVLVRIDETYFRPAEVDLLQGDSSKARTVLGWQPRVSFPELVRMMVDADMELLLPGSRAFSETEH